MATQLWQHENASLANLQVVLVRLVKWVRSHGCCSPCADPVEMRY